MEKMVNEFINELSLKGAPSQCDNALRRAFELHEKRMKKEKLDVRICRSPYGHFSEGREVLTWQDDHYKTTVFATTAICDRKIYKCGKEKPLKKVSGNYLLYTNVTDCKDYLQAADDAYTCPSCGHPSTLGQLGSQGCSYCGTRFSMSELYPKISNYYAVTNFGGTEKEVKGQILTYIKKLLIPFGIMALLIGIGKFNTENLFESILNLVFFIAFAIIFSGIIGYLLWTGKTLFKLFFEAGKTLPKLTYLGSRNKFVEMMKEYSEEFSYEYFSDKVIALLKMIIYSSEDSLLPCYTGKETTRFDHIIESDFTGLLGLESFKVDDGVCTVEATAFMDNFYHLDGKIRRKEEKIHLTVKKDLTKPMDFYFNIQAVKCPSCGSSFDALSRKTCPYCGTQPDIKKEDWVITDIH